MARLSKYDSTNYFVTFVVIPIVLVCIASAFSQGAPEAYQARRREPSAEVKQLQAMREELQAANKQIADLQKSLRESNEIVSGYNKQLPDIDITDLSKTVPKGPFVQWVITTSPSCGPCHRFVDRVIAQLNPSQKQDGWRIGPDEGAQFRVVSISDDDWQKSGWRLPHIELFVDGVSLFKGTPDNISINDMADMWNAEFNKAPKTDNTYGIKVATVPIKPKVEALLKALQPFFDEGTLEITYKPKNGAVKDFLTIKQGNVGIRIPAHLAVNIGMDDKRMQFAFSKPAPEVIIPIRGNTAVKSMTLAPDKFAIQLSYMFDPEFYFTDPK